MGPDDVVEARLERHRERHLAVAQEITHIGSWEWDLATNVVSWSDELYRIYGLAPRSRPITLEVFLSFLEPADRARIQGEVQRAIARGGRFTYHERIVRPDGSRRDLDTIGEVIPGADGRPIALIGSCRDITEQLRRDEAARLYADIVQNIQIGIAVWRVDDPGDVASAKLVAFNPHAEKIAGASMTPLVGASLADAYPSVLQGGLAATIAEVVRDRCVREVSITYQTAPATSHHLVVRVFPLPASSIGLAFEDVTRESRARAMRASEQRVLEMIASGAPLSDVLTALLVAIEGHAPGTFGSVLLLDPQGTHLRHGAAPSLPPDMLRAIDGAAIGPSHGSCGTAAYRNEAVLVEDVETSPLWNDWRHVLRPHGLRACWSTPIAASDGRAVGTFALYYREPRLPTPDERDLIARATHLAGIAIQREQREDRLRALSAHVEAVQEQERTAVAREIHDELGQALTALKIDVAWVSRRTPNDEASAPVRARLASMSTMIDGIIDTVRRISSDLRPGVLDELGLVAALEWKTQHFEEHVGIPCSFHTDVGDVRFPREFGTALYRMLQEALTNVVRHADASHVEVSLHRVGERLRLEVLDDGKGITSEAATNPRSLGLLGVHERARRLGGEVKVARAERGGTSFVVDVPWPVMRGGAT
ncbi:GAF domain-containing sensor histidine kinase [Sandaracinus amylolyticus]|uniref:Diguanylate cyclase/phosphodiesterase (GGDEF & EAL domains) with PAS/PAC sensor(S) n=1 Tax=Sandaracinus amylolyticus TaxID=927083 RepID=A0A0F6W0M9_9BACT|nr:GAF domain-containing sensor histidine kinase [Sandaracinus amylolyticus]AKF04221.1 diguanylate cyclase/phosphodiesterase (GGDEF & EAL domains) with PAS/PAC sensor(s) [Sandaracinus amylolyticus]